MHQLFHLTNQNAPTGINLVVIGRISDHRCPDLPPDISLPFTIAKVKFISFRLIRIFGIMDGSAFR